MAEATAIAHPVRLAGLWAAWLQGMLFYLLLPVAALLVAVHAIADPGGWSANAPWRATMVWFSLIYTISNVIH